MKTHKMNTVVLYTDKYNYKQQCGLGAFLNMTQKGSTTEHNGQEASYK